MQSKPIWTMLNKECRCTSHPTLVTQSPIHTIRIDTDLHFTHKMKRWASMTKPMTSHWIKPMNSRNLHLNIASVIHFETMQSELKHLYIIYIYCQNSLKMETMEAHRILTKRWKFGSLTWILWQSPHNNEKANTAQELTILPRHGHGDDYSGTSSRIHRTQSAYNTHNRVLPAAQDSIQCCPAPIATSTLPQFPPNQNANPNQPPHCTEHTNSKTQKTPKTRKKKNKRKDQSLREETFEPRLSAAWGPLRWLVARLRPIPRWVESVQLHIRNRAIPFLCTRVRSTWRREFLRIVEQWLTRDVRRVGGEDEQGR